MYIMQKLIKGVLLSYIISDRDGYDNIINEMSEAEWDLRDGCDDEGPSRGVRRLARSLTDGH